MDFFKIILICCILGLFFLALYFALFCVSTDRQNARRLRRLLNKKAGKGPVKAKEIVEAFLKDLNVTPRDITSSAFDSNQVVYSLFVLCGEVGTDMDYRHYYVCEYRQDTQRWTCTVKPY